MSASGCGPTGDLVKLARANISIDAALLNLALAASSLGLRARLVDSKADMLGIVCCC